MLLISWQMHKCAEQHFVSCLMDVVCGMKTIMKRIGNEMTAKKQWHRLSGCAIFGCCFKFQVSSFKFQALCLLVAGFVLKCFCFHQPTAKRKPPGV